MTSKLPNTGTSIFAVMSGLSNQNGAINLAQGFPDFPIAEDLIDLIHHYMKAGHNQYAPMPGVPDLRQAIAKKIERTRNVGIDPDQQITITSGATEALYAAITTIVNPGDEVIYFDPAYDSYLPSIQLNQGIPVPIKLNADDFSIPFDELERRISTNTKLIIINTPHNPTGSSLSRMDLDRLAALIADQEIYVLSDEVYEHLIFDGREHATVVNHPELKDKSVAVYSFGKTFHATGWKMGYAVAPEKITNEIRKVHQFLVFSVNTPIQFALADYLSQPENYDYLPGFFEEKRNVFLKFMEGSRFRPVKCSGTYFQTFSYDGIAEKTEMEMARWMTEVHGVASIPLSPFYTDGADHKHLRFCFAKNEDTLKEAAQKLCQI